MQKRDKQHNIYVIGFSNVEERNEREKKLKKQWCKTLPNWMKTINLQF